MLMSNQANIYDFETANFYNLLRKESHIIDKSGNTILILLC